MRRRTASMPFDQQCRLTGNPVPVPEHRFHPSRRWRIDWAFLAEKLALEVEGGIFIGGRHSRGVGMLKDMEKYNTLTAMGWRLVRVTPKQVETGEALKAIEAVLKQAQP